MADVSYGSLPFAEQIQFFRRKVNLSTHAWTDVFAEAHDHAFMVAGANRTEIVEDFRDAIDRAIANGETLEQFRKRFDTIVAKYGWDYNGGRNWRSRVIYETNLRQSYNAGRWQQLQALKKVRPYWRYRHADGERYPRPLHESWNNLVLSADDPWWLTHFPANGWGCKCFVDGLNERDLKRLGKTGPDTAPPIDMQQVTIGQRSPGGARTVETPAGVDPGFGYTPGRDVWLREEVSRVLQAADAQAQEVWEPILTRDPAWYGRTTRMPLAPAPMQPGPPTPDVAALRQAMHDVLGAPARVFDVHGLPMAVDADFVVNHIATHLERGPYLPWLPDLLGNPFEVWLSLERGRTSGRYRMRARVLKAYDLGRGRVLLFVADQQDGVMTGWTFIQSSDRRYMNRQRNGMLWWGEP